MAFGVLLIYVAARLPSPAPSPPQKDSTLAKPNYQFEKRQRDLANKKKKEEKRLKKLEKSQVSSSADPDQSLQPDADTNQPADKASE
jgi:hypothetical protein